MLDGFWSRAKERIGGLLPWLVPAATAIAIKLRILASPEFHDAALGIRASGILTGWEKASLLRGDLLLGFVFIPAGLWLLTLPLTRRWQSAAITIAALLAEVLLLAEALSRSIAGSFVGLRIIATSIAFALRTRDTSIVFVSRADQVEIAAWIALLAAFAALAWTARGRFAATLHRAVLLLLAAGTLGSTMLYVPAAPAMIWRDPMLAVVSRAAFASPAPDAGLMTRSTPELYALYRENARAPQPDPSAWFGRAQDYNVLFFVLETAPAQVFDPARDDLRDMPNMRRLRQHSFVAAEHYTTLPLSICAYFSMFTSLYPRGPGRTGRSLLDHQVELPGIVRSLHAAGYATGFYGVVWRQPQERDDRVFDSLGFDHVTEPMRDPADPALLKIFQGPIENAETADRGVLQRLRADIRGWTGARRRFLAAFIPQLGHDPWRDLPGAKPSRSLLDRGHALVVRQDAWLGELLGELDRDGALQHTIVVVTGDHGLRMVGEGGDHVQFVTGKLDDLMVHVPLMIYVPGAVDAPVSIPWPTSHIDIAPSVLDLLGVTGGREWEEGGDIWNPALQHRRLFVPIDLFEAAEAYYDGAYYKRSRNGTVFKSNTIHFEDKDALLQTTDEARRAKSILAEQDRIQAALLAHLLDGKPAPASDRR